MQHRQHLSPGDSRRLSTPMRVVASLDVLAKVTLLVLVIVILIDPTWGNLEGKAPVGRAVVYPLWALVVPAYWWLRRRGPFPWLPDLLFTLTSFSDVLGNRLDLYDSVFWFDDFMHFACTGLISAGMVLLTEHPHERLRDTATRAIAFGLTASMAWEIWEYVSFVTHSDELGTAYGDTLGDLSHGWLGAVVAAFVVDRIRRHVHDRSPGESGHAGRDQGPMPGGYAGPVGTWPSR